MRFRLLWGAVAFLALAAVATASEVTHDSVTLTWEAPGDDAAFGIAATYDIRYSTNPLSESNFASAPRWLNAPVPRSPGTTQTVTIGGLRAGTLYYFALKVSDEVPNWSAMSNVITRTTMVGPDTIAPAPIAALTGTALDESRVKLDWIATGDDGLVGTAATCDVRWSRSPITEANWSSATTVTGEPKPPLAGSAQSFTVTGLQRETTYYFAVKYVDDAGNSSRLSNALTVTTPDLTAPAAVVDLGVDILIH